MAMTVMTAFMTSSLQASQNGDLTGDHQYTLADVVAGLQMLTNIRPFPPQKVELKTLGRTVSQGFGVSAAEIVAFDPSTKRIFTVNAESGKLDVFNAADVTSPTLHQSIDLKEMLVTNGKAPNMASVGSANSVCIHGNLAAVAVAADPKTEPGWVIFINVSSLAYMEAVQVGALPDMATFTPDGGKVVVANEGEPGDYTTDPEGSIDIIHVADYSRQRAGFSEFNTGGPRAAELPAGVRIYGRIVNADGQVLRPSTVAEDLEPEYIAVSGDASTAYVTLQENNAIAVIDLASATVAKIFALGCKDHSLAGNELDASDKDGQVNIRNWPVFGMYLPDAIAVCRINNMDYLLTANEGDTRADWGIEQESGINENMEEFRIKELTLDPAAFPNAGELQANAQIGRLKGTSKMGDTDGDGDFDRLYTFGTRSFSIWNAATGELVFDSGSSFERLTAEIYGLNFNNDNDESSPDGRSDDKGPEPEAVTTGVINGHTYAFIGLERMGGIMVYDISNPQSPAYIKYFNDRDITKDPEEVGAEAGDLGPEGLIFISQAASPNGKPLLMVGNEVSGATAIYQVDLTE